MIPAFLRTMLIFTFLLCFVSVVFAQEIPKDESLIQAEIQKNTKDLILKVREDMAGKTYDALYSLLSSKLTTSSPIVKTWFFYVMWAESGKLSGHLSGVVNSLPSQGGFLIFKKALSLWNGGDVLSAARLLGYITSKDPSLAYLVGKLYLSVGKLYQGAGYLYLGAKMQEAPYGLYYAGIGQNAVGEFSNAKSFLSDANSLLLPEEKDLGVRIHLQQAVAQLGKENFQDAYEIVMPIYATDPILTLQTLDPGILLTAMNKNKEAKDFWNAALKKRLPSKLSSRIRKNLAYNKRLTDPNYPPRWLRH